jgi:hypothetical protein
MSAASYGIIVEGAYDSAVYGAIIRKLTSPNVHIRSFECGGKPKLMRTFPDFLEALKYEVAGAPVEMAIVIVDADGQDPLTVETNMRSKIVGRHYPFPLDVRFHAVHQAVDTWLLADTAAVSKTVRTKVTPSYRAPEELQHPKQEFRKLLFKCGVGSTPLVCSRIAQTRAGDR